MSLELKVARPYDFDRSVRDYGWIALAPVRWLDDVNALRRVERLDTGRVVVLQVTGHEAAEAVTLRIDVEADSKLAQREQEEIRRKVHWMLKLDEDLSEFYRVCASDPVLWEKLKTGRGRLLRSPTLFEDVVKTICTTNTTWSQTKGMVERIVRFLGDPFPGDPDLHAFPTPEQILAGEALFKDKIRLGYRNDYVLQLAREVVEKHCDLEALKNSGLPAAEMRRELKRIKGIGDYAASTLLMSLGYYDSIAVDTEVRALVVKKYFNGYKPTDREIAAVYDHWGRWKYLAYWFDSA
jgi:3-methyladenine DNA glycosylase/8-oxoguanine DNA glycosylase